MRKFLATFCILVSMIFSSCSVYENIYFLDDGSVKYELAIDGKEMMAAISSMDVKNFDNIPSDSVIHLVDLIKDSIDVSSKDIQEALTTIEPIYIKYENNIAEGKLGVSLYGNFENADALNKAFAAMSQLDKYRNKDNADATQNFPIEALYNETILSWDGKTMKRIVNSKTDNEENENPLSNQGLGSFAQFFARGSLTVKYHFPNKIKEVSNPDAALSLDGKTVIVQYPGSILTEPTDKFSIQITTEK